MAFQKKTLNICPFPLVTLLQIINSELQENELLYALYELYGPLHRTRPPTVPTVYHLFAFNEMQVSNVTIYSSLHIKLVGMKQ